MGEREEKIKRIADSLVKSGLAVNETEAFRKAEEIIATEEKTEPKIDVKVEKQTTDDLDITKEDKTINELMQEAGVDVNKIEKAEETSKENIAEKKVEKEKTTEKKPEKEQKKQKTNKYEEEGKVDISKVFNYGRK